MTATVPEAQTPASGNVTPPATFYVLQGGNDLYWRVEAPARAIGANTVLIPEATGFEPVMVPNQDQELRWSLNVRTHDNVIHTVTTVEEWVEFNDRPRAVKETWADYPDHEGVAVWTRPDLSMATHAKAMRRNGVKTIAEIDDNYFCPPEQNLFLRMAKWTDEMRLDHARAVASQDAVILSTEYLRDIYWREIKERFGRKSVPPLHVCHNNVAEKDWPNIVERDGPVRVGWMGSQSHLWDVDYAWSALMVARNMGAETVLIGFNPITDVHVDERRGGGVVSKEKIEAWKKVGFKHIPWILPEKYHRLALPLDIGLCPLLTNDFTLGKSDVKFVEYAISGAATVAQNNPVYNRTIIHGETGFLAGSPAEFTYYTELLIRDENLRLRLVENAQQYVREERGLKQLQDEWSAALAA